MSRSRLFLGFLTALALVLGACGDDGDDTEIGTGETTEADDTSDTTAMAEDSDDPDDAAEDAAEPPAEDTGTVTIGGETAEITGDDFLICETVNPAFEETINIIVRIPFAPEQFGVGGDLPDEVDVRLGSDSATEILAEDVEVSREGRTVSGTATSDGDSIEFSFTC